MFPFCVDGTTILAGTRQERASARTKHVTRGLSPLNAVAGQHAGGFTIEVGEYHSGAVTPLGRKTYRNLASPCVSNRRMPLDVNLCCLANIALLKCA